MQLFSPMLLNSSQPFDSTSHIYELKLDGIRCIIYCINGKVTLRNRQGRDITHLFPELTSINKSIKGDVVLDSELVIIKQGKPSLYSVLARLNGGKGDIAELAVFDILYNKEDITSLPLYRRKQELDRCVSSGNGLSGVSFIENNGIGLFNSAKSMGLEGIVAKHKDSVYVCGKRTSHWLKIKAVVEAQAIICGIICQKNRVVLADTQMNYLGVISLSNFMDDKRIVFEYAHNNTLPNSPLGISLKDVIWCKPYLVCSISYLPGQDGLRHLSYRGLTTK